MSAGWESQLKVEGGAFRTTHWSVVRAAAQTASSDGAAAMAELCRAYWYPLFQFLRGWSNSAEEAKDLTQEFFARLLEKPFLEGLDPSVGRFRSFLLAAAKHFLKDNWGRRTAQKRGGGLETLSLDDESLGTLYNSELVEPTTPEMKYDKIWALTLIDRVLARLREEYTSAGRGEVFEALKKFLSEKKPTPQAIIAAELGISVSTAGVAIHRLRRRFKDLLHDEVAKTVDGPDEVEDELRQLIAALGS